MRISVVIVVAALALTACGRKFADNATLAPLDGSAESGVGACAMGSASCACYGNGTCNAGLGCVSGLCVKRPLPGGNTMSDAAGPSARDGSASSDGRANVLDAGRKGPIDASDTAQHDGGPPARHDGGSSPGETDARAPGMDGATGTLPDAAMPPVPGCVAQISAGSDQTCARKKDGSLWCWGSDNLGELGNGEAMGYSLVPVEVAALGHTVADVIAGEGRTCARKTDGTLWCWGMNVFGAVGDGTTGGITCGGSDVCRASPTQVVGSIGKGTVGFGLGNWATCAYGSDTSLWCWGLDAWGQLGVAPTGKACGPQQACEPSPVEVTALGKGVVQVAGGESQTCALLQNGTAWCWGNLQSSGGPQGTYSPTEIAKVATFVRIAAGPDHECALDDKGSMWCWTWGAGPQRVDALGTSVAELGAGGPSTSCARTTDGAVYCWSGTASGHIGDEPDAGTNPPQLVDALPHRAIELSVGGGYSGHDCALLVDGSVWCWGRNDFGQLGDGTNSPRLNAVEAKLCP
ncbi:MAG TPA: hypothetical protein VH062_15635 [Polyangiaceae bacterium]|jgi:alpha-tubulin suppressor-like RCC1 family protein|nr:hypothetical protein [Polyangiaceae bacterium]